MAKKGRFKPLGKNVWGNLVFSAANATKNGWRSMMHPGQSPLNYKSKSAYYSVVAQYFKQLAASEAANLVNRLASQIIHSGEKKKLEYVRKIQKDNNDKLIDNGFKQQEKYNALDIGDGEFVYAVTANLRNAEGALFLSYKDTEYSTLLSGDGYFIGDSELRRRMKKGEDFRDQYWGGTSTNVVFYVDLVPSISVSSQKNVVLTQVQGRDFTRKELISGGDLVFTVNGKLMSNQNGIYPDFMVRRFLNVMQYGGVLDVNNIIFNQLGVTKVIVKEFSLGNMTHTNVQPYTMSCVAIEPNDNVNYTTDEMDYNYKKVEAGKDTWFEKVLNSKFGGAATKAAIGAAASIATDAIGTSLDLATDTVHNALDIDDMITGI